MKLKIDDAISELYGNMLYNKASIRVLREMIIGYAKMKDKVEGDALVKYYTDHMDKYFRDLILESPLQNEYLDKLVEQLLKDIRD